MRQVTFRILAGLLAVAFAGTLFMVPDPFPLHKLIGSWCITVVFASYALGGNDLAEWWLRMFGLAPSSKQPPLEPPIEDEHDT